MKKTLTEQWREGTLSMGYYYVSKPTRYGGEAIKYLDDDCSFGLGEDIIHEVLAPVPSYDEWKKLTEKLHLREHLLLRIKQFLSEWDTPMDILAELEELEESKMRRDK